jgi:glycosyltransferase involved in cell wall biosynthesis
MHAPEGTKQAVGPDQKPRVSVVICTYNRHALLTECLTSLFSQTYPKEDYEIIVVDDGSTDGTEGVVRELGQTSKRAPRYLRQENKGPGAGRNLGIKNARGEIIAFTDDDCIASETWIENGVPYFADDDIVGVEGRTLPAEPVRLQVFPPRFSYTLQVTDESWTYPTCNMFYRKRAILDVGGFNEEYRAPGPEDADLAWRMREKGMKIVFSSEPLVYHAVLYYTLADRLRSMKRYQFEPLLFRDHPRLRKNLLLGFVYSKEVVHAPFFVLTVLAGLLGSLLGASLLPAAILAVMWTVVYLWSNVLVDQNVRQFPLRIALFPVKLLLHSTKLYYHLLGSIRYRSLII